ncbi:hypothetical protein [Saccharospirillum salsuginis]|uniref:Uncharacterized protein n=1 Tax=Saccharospirillum salsuginis TaxID=418750 RepID=A0A918NFL7_9GAMM|nr:hypothetical protein [Saccharospirillum salsuginis]GGX63936.1 hypothetical protein GCM10007392_34490 [Saccharospirillum salsuginis]
MLNPIVAAYVFGLLAGVAVLFQWALALGAPWGEMAMGGRYPGRFPPGLRFAALVQSFLLVVIALVVFTRAGMMLGDYLVFSRYAIWFVVGFCGISAVLNTITPSKKERLLWAPVTFGLLVCGLIVALS